MLLVAKASQPLFTGFVLLAILIGQHEFYAMTLPHGRTPERVVGLTAGLLLAGFMSYGQTGPALMVLAGAFMLSALLILFRFRELQSVVQQLALVLIGLLYVPLLLSHLPLLRGLDDGHLWVFLALVIAMAGDSSALFVGRALGRRKLYEAISPNKSIEGALGGVAGSVAGAVIFKLLFFPNADLLLVIGMSLLLSVLAQLGDLFESMLKRSCQVKDSGSIIPGHGGMLDRLDSLLFVFPPAFYLASYFG